MGRSTCLLFLSMLGTAACVPDAVTGPEPAAPTLEAAARSASDASVVDEAAPALKSGPRAILLRESKSARSAADLLYIVDGVIMTQADVLDRLEAGEVESIEVLKRASAHALYGNRTWDAVVLITTRGARPRRSGR